MLEKRMFLVAFLAVACTTVSFNECHADLVVTLNTNTKVGTVTGEDTGTLTAGLGGQSRGIAGWQSGKLVPSSGISNLFLGDGDFVFGGVTPNFGNPNVLDLQFGSGANSDDLAVFSLILDFAGQPGAVGTVAPQGGSVSFDYSSLSFARQTSFETFMSSSPSLSPVFGTGFQPLNSSTTAVPEPSSCVFMGLLGLSTVGINWRRRRRLTQAS